MKATGVVGVVAVALVALGARLAGGPVLRSASVDPVETSACALEARRDSIAAQFQECGRLAARVRLELRLGEEARRARGGPALSRLQRDWREYQRHSAQWAHEMARRPWKTRRPAYWRGIEHVEAELESYTAYDVESISELARLAWGAVDAAHVPHWHEYTRAAQRLQREFDDHVVKTERHRALLRERAGSD